MIVTAGRLRSMGWVAVLAVCVALVMVMAFRVNALRSQVHQSQARIAALKAETMYLETEFETRANQQQLKAWNDVEFGYVAPTATQYLDNERQLASYAKPAEPGAPAPVRVASADDNAAAVPAMVSPLTGKALGETSEHATFTPAKADDDGDAAPGVRHNAKMVAAVAATGLAGLGDRLSTVYHAGHDKAAATTSVKSVKAGSHKATAAAHKSAKDAKPRPHLASAADAHRRAAAAKPSGTTPLRLALKDARAIK
jgi:hypothetical protein